MEMLSGVSGGAPFQPNKYLFTQKDGKHPLWFLDAVPRSHVDTVNIVVRPHTYFPILFLPFAPLPFAPLRSPSPPSLSFIIFLLFFASSQIPSSLLPRHSRTDPQTTAGVCTFLLLYPLRERQEWTHDGLTVVCEVRGKEGQRDQRKNRKHRLNVHRRSTLVCQGSKSSNAREPGVNPYAESNCQQCEQNGH